MEYAAERIEHLSKEIETVMNHTMTFRTRIGFTVLVGPFIVMGSVLFSTGAAFKPPVIDLFFISSAVVAITSYFCLAWYGSKLENHMSSQCNVWRQAIIDISQDKVPSNDQILFEHKQTIAYLFGFLLVGLAFLSSVICISLMM